MSMNLLVCITLVLKAHTSFLYWPILISYCHWSIQWIKRAWKIHKKDLKTSADVLSQWAGTRELYEQFANLLFAIYGVSNPMMCGGLIPGSVKGAPSLEKENK